MLWALALLPGCLSAPEPGPRATGDSALVLSALAEANAAAPPVDLPATGSLTARAFVQTLTRTDEQLRNQALEVAIAREGIIAARGSFDPAVYATASRTGERRQTSASQVTTLLGANDPFWEYTTEGEIGVNLRRMNGVTVDLYLQMSDVENSVQASSGLPSPEYNLETGFRVAVPLMRGAGQGINTAPIRIAEVDEDIARLTVPLLQAQRAYEALRVYTRYQRATARISTRRQALALTERIAREVEGQQATGLSSASDVTLARARVAEAQAALTQARIDQSEQRDLITSFLTGATGGLPTRGWQPSDPLTPVNRTTLRAGNLQQVYALRPDLAIFELEIARAAIQTEVAQDAVRPEVNVTLDYARTHLDEDPAQFDDLLADNPNNRWSLGVEYRHVLGQNQTAEAEFRSAILRQRQAMLRLSAFQQRLAGEVQAIEGILQRAEQALSQTSAQLRDQTRLVRAEEDRQRAGLATPVEVMTRQLEELLAREARNDAVAQLNQAYFLSGYVGGRLLNAFGVQ